MNLYKTFGLTVLAATVALAGCAQPMRRDGPGSRPMAPNMDGSTRGDVESTAPAAPPKRKPRSTPPMQPPAGSEELPVTPAEPAREEVGDSRPAGSLTGVPVCDRYLASYKQCHATIGQYAPTQIDERYQRIRDTLTSKSGTPEGRAEISATCKNLAALVTEALNGRKCGDPAR
ncbi:MAG: hypothetical protein ABIP49_05510 [Lysobacterales bacterium]